MTEPGLVRVGDVLRTIDGADVVHILGFEHVGSFARGAWRARFIPTHEDYGDPFNAAHAFDFAERDATAPGGLLAAADPWSTWTESSA